MSNLFCGDVGQERREEVNLVRRGGNYGWSEFEGTLKTPNYPDQVQYIYEYPIIEYEHYVLGGSPAVIGGYVSYTTRDPCLQGQYVYGDWQGLVWAAQVNSSGQWDSRETLLFLAPAASNPTYWAGLGNLFGFGEDDRADLYLLAQSGIYRIVERSRCNLPASCTATAPPQPTPPPTESQTPAPTTGQTSAPTSAPTTASPTTAAPTPRPSVTVTSSAGSPATTSGTVRPPATTGRVSNGISNHNVSALLLIVALLVAVQTVLV